MPYAKESDEAIRRTADSPIPTDTAAAGVTHVTNTADDATHVLVPSSEAEEEEEEELDDEIAQKRNEESNRTINPTASLIADPPVLVSSLNDLNVQRVTNV